MEPSPDKLYCYVHPNRETLLRCNRCDRPICSSCAVRTPTGYRCKECVRGHQRVFDTARWIDYPLAILAAGGLSYLGSRLVSMLGFFTILVAPIAGVIIAEVVRWLIRKRRSRLLFQLVAIAVAAGALPLLLINLLMMVQGVAQGFSFIQVGLLSVIWQGVYAAIAASSAYYRLSGIQIR